MARTTQQQLDDLDAAIEKVEKHGQAYTIEGRSLTRANLPEAYRERRSLQARLERETRGGVRVRYGRLDR